ncbi:MAG: DUF1573 domain-containing protein [Planctomycetota bacterium]|nr:DUF1573 domain-containing protein [Planctomycetota bacterium]
MRVLPTISLLALLVSACGGPPELIQVTPSKHDFGRVMQGETREISFKVKNNGERTVAFKAVPNCACLAVAHGLRPLDPGQTQEFHVLLDTAHLTGPVQGKWVTLNTDHPGVPGVVIPIEGEIFEAFTLQPKSFRFGTIDGRPANYEARVIRVRPMSDYTIGLARAVSVPDVLATKVIPHASGGFDVHVSIPRDVRRPIGPFRAHVRLEMVLTAPSGTEIKLSRKATFDGVWRLRP